jgi:hypothetical protein
MHVYEIYAAVGAHLGGTRLGDVLWLFEPITHRTYELNKLSSYLIIRIINALVGSFIIYNFGFQEFWILALTSLSSTVQKCVPPREILPLSL